MLAPCVNWQEKLAALHPDALSPVERAALDAHMKGCPGCTAAFADYKKMSSLISEAFVCESPLELPEWLTQEDLAKTLPPLPALYQNLPPRFDHFFGRQMELARAVEILKSPHAWLTIGGVSGIGKTTFALEAAYQCLQGSDLMPNPLFDAAVWISVSDRWNRERWLSEVLNTIARVLDHRSVAQLSFQEKCIKVNELLRIYRTLVIIDDFDKTDDDALRAWIQQIPEPSKILVTSHEAHQFHQTWTLCLEGLKKEDAPGLISHFVPKLGVSALESAEISDLLHITHGNPQAIAMTLGNFKSSGLSLHQVLDELRSAEDILDCLFTRAWSTLTKNPDAQRTLLALSFFEGSARKEALGAAVEIDSMLLEEALTQLIELSLIEVSNDGRQIHYGLHSLTRAFADIKLKEEPNWEQQARERWIRWWLAFTKEHGGPDKMEWAEHYGLIDEERVNLSLVCEWCVAHDQYETLQAFWHSERLLWMTSIYGCWKLRLTWLRRITTAAEEREDKVTALEAMIEQGFTLTQMGRTEEAGEMLREAWSQNHFLSLRVRATLAENLVQLYMRLNDFKLAQHWLATANRLVQNLDDSERPRHELTIQYYYGVMYTAEGDRKQAEIYFQKTLKGAREIGWQRCVIYVEQFFADIARTQGMFDEAKDLLKTECSLAYLALLQLWQKNEKKELHKVINWAQRALNSIEPFVVHPAVMKQLETAPTSPSVVCFGALQE